MTSFLKGLSRFVFNHYTGILLVSCAGLFLSVLLVFNIKVRTDIMDLLPADNPSMNLFNDILRDSGGMNSLIIVIRSDAPDIEHYVSLIDEIGEGLKRSSLVRDVEYSGLSRSRAFMMKYFPLYMDNDGIAVLKKRLTPEGIFRQIRENYRRVASPFSSVIDSTLIAADPLNIRAILIPSITGKKEMPLDLSTGYYLGRDHTFALIFVSPSGTARDMAFVKSLKKKVESVVENVLIREGMEGKLRAGYAGPFALAWEAQEALERDMLGSLLITVFLILLVFFLLFRWSVIIPTVFLTLSLVVLWTLSIAHLLFGGLNIITAVVSAVLVGLGIDYTIHIFDRFAMELKRTDDPAVALETTLLNTGRSVLTGSLTTAGAFFSIVVTDFRGLHELGTVAGLGILLCMLSTLIVMTALMLLIFRLKKGLLIKEQTPSWLEQALPDVIIRNGRTLSFFMVIVIILALPGLGRVRFYSDLREIGLKDSRAMRIQKELSGILTADRYPLIVVYTGETGMEEAIDTIEKKLKDWKEKGLIGSYTSLEKVFPPPFRQRAVIDELEDIRQQARDMEKVFIAAMKRYGFNITENNLRYIRGIIKAINITSPVSLEELSEIGENKIGFFYNPEKNRLVAYFYPSSENWSGDNLVRLKKLTESLGPGWQITGWPLLSGQLKKTIVRESIIAALLSLFFSLVITFLHFRKVMPVVLSQLPVLVGFILTCGIMGYMDIGFNYINMASIALLFGIAIDYGVYLVQAVSEGGRKDYRVIRHAFKNMLICSVTTMVGFGSLVTTNFRGISSLGAVIVIGVVSCLAAATLILPASLRYKMGS